MLISYSENGESKQREATAQEKKEIQAAQADAQTAKKLEEKAKADRALAKSALLDRLGITADEAALLV